MNSKGSVPDLVLHPLFVVGIALGIVLLILLKSIYSIGSSDEFEKRFIATDVALLVDSLYAVKPEISLVMNHPVKFQGIISQNKVTVFDKKKEDGKSFFFTEDKDYKFQYGSWLPNTNIYFFKSGNELGIGNKLSVKPYCPSSDKSFDIIVNQLGLNQESWATDSNGNPVIRGSMKLGNPVLKIYINQNKDTPLLACRIAQSLSNNIDLQGFAIIPLNSDFVEADDPKKEIAKSQGPGMYIELTAPKRELARVHVFTAIKRGTEGGR